MGRREDVLKGERDLVHRVHADAMALAELQGMVRQPASGIGWRRFTRVCQVDELERRTVLRAQLCCTREGVVAMRGEIGDGKDGTWGHGRTAFGMARATLPAPGRSQGAAQ